VLAVLSTHVVRRAEVLLVFAAIVVLAFLVARPHEPELSPRRASWTLTPGLLNPEVTQRTIAVTICKRGWTRTIRPPTSYTTELKRKQMRAYARSGDLSDYQEDHLISLELGGHPTDPRNLWPQPYPRASEVDRKENELNDAVCAGDLSLAEAQRRESLLKHTHG
jgi:hypothetical protein